VEIIEDKFWVTGEFDIIDMETIFTIINTVLLILDSFLRFNLLFCQQFCLYAINGGMIG